MPVTPGQEGAEGHALNPTEIRVLSVGKSLKIEPFKIPENPLEVGRTWREWIEDFFVFLSRLNEISGGCEKILPVSDHFGVI